ncbi:MarR family winged helix-turn-helix transcriptional regulator [Cupriavidus sp. 2SB]|uniref:MarR family winged helix-turn-helix transcriptional regulator n=1 Tax=Cupriavidus sp. 2SB TaxID=2502199 RepID=UPI0010F72C9C|nr:MarR family winged helix-turn-helix transcriptional regulator [Cupriavidus sp. 2SB]
MSIDTNEARQKELQAQRKRILAQRRPLPQDDLELLDQCTLFDVHRLSRLLTGIYNGYLRESGLTIAQFTLLRNIHALAPAGMKRIAEAMLMDRTSVTRLIEPLIKDGLLRDEVGQDRRYRNIVLTAKGLVAVTRSEEAWSRAQEDLYNRIGAKQWRTLRTALRDTIQLVRAMSDESEA